MDRSEKFLDFLNKLCLGLLVVVTGWAALLNRPLFSDGSLRVYDFLTTQSFPHNMPSLRWTTHFMQIPSWISYNFFKGDLAVNLGLTAFSWSYAFYPLLGLLFVLRFVPKEEEFYRKFLLITFIWIIHPASLFAVNYVNESAMLFLFATTLIQFHSNRNFFLPLILLSFFGLAVGYESGIIFVPVLGLQMYLKKRTGDLSKLRFLILSFTACLVAAWLFKELYRFDTVVTTPHTIGFWSSFGRWRYSHLHKGITFIPISLCLLFLFKNKTKFQVLPLLLVGLCFYFSMVDIFIREIPMTAGLAFDLRVWVAPLLGISYFFFHFSHWKGWDRFSVQKEAASKIILLGFFA